ncbi:MAG TPA: succinate dehydrogenase assembly factor 2 [Nevskiaceae bacterium]|nr:succinate dehydrogenase assembly factor 2 [Nevskiaceae bacterium]
MSVDDANPAPQADVAIDGKLRWRCRRGMKELDVLLERYLAQRLAHADGVERAAFRRLLEIDDPTLWHWFSGGSVADPALAQIVGHIRGCH